MSYETYQRNQLFILNFKIDLMKVQKGLNKFTCQQIFHYFNKVKLQMILYRARIIVKLLKFRTFSKLKQKYVFFSFIIISMAIFQVIMRALVYFKRLFFDVYVFIFTYLNIIYKYFMFNFIINEMCKMLKSTIILIHCMQAKTYLKKFYY